MIDTEDVWSILKTGAETFGLEIGPERMEKFKKYLSLLQEWNEKINLTSIIEANEVVVKHYLDSLALCRIVGDNKQKFIDIGTGAGFPGIPVKLCRPQIELYLLDATAKKTEFLKLACRELGIDATVITARAEEAGQAREHRGVYDLVTSRAVAEMIPLAEYSLPLLKVGGRFIALKAKNVAEEVNLARKAITVLGGEVKDIVTTKIPFSDLERNMIIVEKVRPTPPQYPRKPGVPKKKPLT